MIVYTLLAAALAFADAAPDSDQIIQRAVKAQKAIADAGLKFTWREEQEQLRSDAKGNFRTIFVKTFDVIMLEGETYKKLVLENGEPLDGKTQRRVDAELEKTRAERKQRSSLTHRTVKFGGVEQLSHLFVNRLAGAETIAGRATWRVESEPRTDVHATNKEDENALATRRTSWFDQADGVAIQRLDRFVRGANGFQPGSEFETHMIQIAGTWQVESVVLRYDVKFAPGVRIRGEDRHRLSDYKRFEVDSRIKPE